MKLFISSFMDQEPITERKTKKNPVETDLNMQEFYAWCKEFNVSVLVNKKEGFDVLVGDKIKHVILDIY